MNKFILVFAACIILLLILLIVIPVTLYKRRQDDDDAFIDKDGNHSYYDKSLIEKKRFFNENPGVHPSEVRSLKSLIRHFYFNKKSS